MNFNDHLGALVAGFREYHREKDPNLLTSDLLDHLRHLTSRMAENRFRGLPEDILDVISEKSADDVFFKLVKGDGLSCEEKHRGRLVVYTTKTVRNHGFEYFRRRKNLQSLPTIERESALSALTDEKEADRDALDIRRRVVSPITFVDREEALQDALSSLHRDILSYSSMSDRASLWVFPVLFSAMYGTIPSGLSDGVLTFFAILSERMKHEWGEIAS